MVELAEAGPELLHFATGGVVPIYERGIYTVPQNTYVSPANANSGTGVGDVHITINVEGSVMSDGDLADRVGPTLVDAMVRAIDQQRRGYGGYS